MIRTILFRLTSAAVLCVAASGPVLAQPMTAEGEITVSAPRTNERSPTGVPIEVVTTTRIVSYRDLDLRTEVGQKELESRVKIAARKACDWLDRLYPITAANSPECLGPAVKDAMAQVNVAVAAARAK